MLSAGDEAKQRQMIQAGLCGPTLPIKVRCSDRVAGSCPEPSAAGAPRSASLRRRSCALHAVLQSRSRSPQPDRFAPPSRARPSRTRRPRARRPLRLRAGPRPGEGQPLANAPPEHVSTPCDSTTRKPRPRCSQISRPARTRPDQLQPFNPRRRSYLQLFGLAWYPDKSTERLLARHRVRGRRQIDRRLDQIVGFDTDVHIMLSH